MPLFPPSALVGYNAYSMPFFFLNFNAVFGRYSTEGKEMY